jgi:hypothetical protein
MTCTRFTRSGPTGPRTTRSSCTALVDNNVWDVTPELYEEMLADAASKVGVENVRQVKVDVPWDAIVAAFEPPKVEGTVQR